MQRLRRFVTLLPILLLLPMALMAQQGLPDAPKPQNQASGLPDAPTSNRTLPTAEASPSNQTRQQTGEATSVDTATQAEINAAQETPPPNAPSHPPRPRR